ncbi:hypothetical protein D3C75_1030850 [compost metagenome]
MTSYATTRRFWTTQEVALLERLYPDLATVDVAARLDRPLSAVHGKAKALGVKKNQTFWTSPFSGRFDGVQGQATRFQKKRRG